MQTADNIMFISPETASPSREAGHLSGGKANGQPPAPGAWAAAVEDMADIEEDVASQVLTSETKQPVLSALLPATDNHRMAVRPKEDGPQQPTHEEPGERLPVNHPAASANKHPAEPPTRLDNPIRPEAAHEYGGPKNREVNTFPVHGPSDIVIFEKTAASTATPADPFQEPDDPAPQAAHPAPVETSMVKAEAEKGGTMAQARAEAQTAARSLELPHIEKAPKPVPETKGFHAAQGPETPLPSRDAPKPPQPAMLEKHPSQPTSLPQMDPQAEKQPSTDLTGSIATLPRKHHPAGKNQPAHNRSPNLPSVEGLSEKSPATPESSAPARPALNLSQTVSLADSPESGRQALGAGHSSQQPVVSALPPVGQFASQPSIAAASASATGLPTHDDGAVLRLELPLWSAVGITEMPVNENQDIRPGPDLPPANREMRMLSDVIEKAYWHQKNGRAQARIQIKPAFLGHLHLNVLTDQARVSVEIRVETPMAREFIEMHLQTLKTDLQDSGLEIDRLDVVVDRDADDAREPFREPTRKQNRQPGPSSEMVEAAPPDKEAVLPETGNTENSINTFA